MRLLQHQEAGTLLLASPPHVQTLAHGSADDGSFIGIRIGTQALLYLHTYRAVDALAETFARGTSKLRQLPPEVDTRPVPDHRPYRTAFVVDLFDQGIATPVLHPRDEALRQRAFITVPVGNLGLRFYTHLAYLSVAEKVREARELAETHLATDAAAWAVAETRAGRGSQQLVDVQGMVRSVE